MTPELESIIAAYPELDPEQAKLIFLRDSAMKSYVEDEIGKRTKETLSEVIELGTVASMSKEEIGIHIANLEKARNYLSALIQGLKKGHAREIEPKLKAKHEFEEKVKKITKPRDIDSKLKALGIDPLKFIASLSANKPSPSATNNNPNPIVKPVCEKCGLEVFSLKYHKC